MNLKLIDIQGYYSEKLEFMLNFLTDDENLDEMANLKQVFLSSSSSMIEKLYTVDKLCRNSGQLKLRVPSEEWITDIRRLLLDEYDELGEPDASTIRQGYIDLVGGSIPPGDPEGLKRPAPLAKRLSTTLSQLFHEHRQFFVLEETAIWHYHSRRNKR